LPTIKITLNTLSSEKEVRSRNYFKQQSESVCFASEIKLAGSGIIWKNDFGGI